MKVGLLFLAILSLSLAGCAHGDWEFHVQNTTARDWLIRVAIGGNYGENQYWTREVKAGASGPAMDWWGPSDKPIQLLEDDCSVAGVFQLNGDVWSVPAISGITGTVHPGGTASDAEWRATFETIDLSDSCGGVVLR
jgi:hypothetical protein